MKGISHMHIRYIRFACVIDFGIDNELYEKIIKYNYLVKDLSKERIKNELDKILISKTSAEHAGEPDSNGTFKVLSKISPLGPDEICTFSYFVAGPFNTKRELENAITYLKTKFARFLILQAVTSINLSKDKFQFVPMQDFSKPWTDAELYTKYNLTQEEIDFIESMIKPMDSTNIKED